jgi:flotillin
MLFVTLSIISLVVFAIFFIATYKVVDPNEAHVVVFMGRGRKVYSAKESKTSYFFVPLLMKKQVLPLTNVKTDIEDIHLHDVKVAPFVCDVITWLHISDPIKAAERLTSSQPFDSLRQDLINIVQSVARAAAMKQEVLEIMKDRATFAKSVSEEVGTVLESWGIQLINLEVNDIRDDVEKQSHVISDYESIRRVQVESLSRQEVAVRSREAVEVESENKQKADVAAAKAEEEIEKQRVQRDRNIALAQQEKEKTIAVAQEQTNAQFVKATQTLEVGKAKVAKEAAIEKANGEAEAVRIKGEKEADVERLKGEAVAKALEAKGVAEATAKLKMAEALKEFNDAGINLEQLRAAVEVEKAKYENLGKALSAADLKLVSSGEGGNLFGFDLNGKTGAALGQMVQAFGGAEKVKEVVGKLLKKDDVK